MVDPITLEMIEQAFERLQPFDQQLLYWSAVDGLSCDEIAAKLGLSHNTVVRHMRRMLTRWDRELERVVRHRGQEFPLAP